MVEIEYLYNTKGCYVTTIKGTCSRYLDFLLFLLENLGDKRGSSSVVERQLPKLNVAGSSPVSRSIVCSSIKVQLCFLFDRRSNIRYPLSFKLKSLLRSLCIGFSRVGRKAYFVVCYETLQQQLRFLFFPEYSLPCWPNGT